MNKQQRLTKNEARESEVVLSACYFCDSVRCTAVFTATDNYAGIPIRSPALFDDVAIRIRLTTRVSIHEQFHRTHSYKTFHFTSIYV